MDLLFVLGTKAQFIKTIPMINLAIKNNLKVTLFNLNQDPEKTKLLLDNIKGEYQYISFVKNDKDLGTYSGLLMWAV